MSEGHKHECYYCAHTNQRIWVVLWQKVKINWQNSYVKFDYAYYFPATEELVLRNGVCVLESIAKFLLKSFNLEFSVAELKAANRGRRGGKNILEFKHNSVFLIKVPLLSEVPPRTFYKYKISTDKLSDREFELLYFVMKLRIFANEAPKTVKSNLSGATKSNQQVARVHTKEQPWGISGI
jgi:hypothetical protein